MAATGSSPGSPPSLAPSSASPTPAPPKLHEDNRGDVSSEVDRFGPEFDRVVVITTETLPDFSAGAAAWTPDEGQTWFPIPQASGYWAVAFANPKAGWFVGNNGTILKVSF